MRNALALKISLLCGLAVMLVIFSISLLLQNGYQTDFQLLLIPKSSAISENFSQLMSSAVIIPKNISFRDQVLAANGLENENAGLPAKKQESLWKSSLNFKRIKDSAIVKASFFGENPMETESTAQMDVRGFVDSLGHYYDARNELAVRIIDGPLTYERSARLYWPQIIWGILFGLVSGFITFLIARAIIQDKMAFRLKPLGTFMPKFELPKFELVKKPKVKKAKKEDNPFVAAAHQKKASAPVNLPTAEHFINQQIEKVIENGIIKTELPEEILAKPEEKNSTREATPEEVKERLNKLLRGGL